jgi:trehalose 6-phosphate phosphatase
MCIMIDHDHRGEIESRVAEATSLVFYVDFDGTLAPIVNDPGLASLSPETRAVLEKFSSREDVLIAVVSGRSLADVKARVGLQSLVYSGDHGLQIEGHSLRFEHPEAARCRDALAELNQQLIGLPLLLPGVQVESKSLTTAVHYRRAPEGTREQIETILRSLVPADHPLFVLTEGKMIVEIRPRVDWNKGTAVRWIQDRLQADGALPFIIGDDRTDEDAFDAIDDAVTIRVGPEESTVAQYCLPDQEAVGEMLHWLLGVWKERRADVKGDDPQPNGRPGLGIKESSPIPSVRLRRSAAIRKRELSRRGDSPA